MHRYLLLIVILCLPVWGQMYPGNGQEAKLLLLGQKPVLSRNGLVAGWDLRAFNVLPLSAIAGRNAALNITASTSATEFTPTGEPAQVYRETAATGYHGHYATITPLIATRTYQYGVFVKADGRDFCALGNATNGHYRAFNLATGTVGGFFGTAYPGIITPFPNGWYLVEITITNILANFSPLVNMMSDATTSQYAGDTTKGILIGSGRMNEGTTLFPYVATGNLQSVGNLVPGGAALQRGSAAGSDTNDPTPSLAGWVFDGVDDYGLGPNMGLTTSDITIVAVHSPATIASGDARIFSARESSVGVELYRTTNKHASFIGDSGGFTTIGSTPELTAGAYVSSVITFKRSSTGQYYHNGAVGGAAVDISSRSGSVARSVSRVGSFGSSTTSLYSGTISFVFIWNRALNPAEIKRLHERFLRPSMASVGVNLP